MSAPEIAQKSPYAVEVGAGKSYWWCACGKSKSQPFCDGSHKVRIPVKPITDSGAKPVSHSGQADHLSERSDAGV